MIVYKCAHCKAKLQTDDSLSGKVEPCPMCAKANGVPLSKQDMERLRQEKAEANAKARTYAQERRRQEQAQELANEQAAAEEYRRQTAALIELSKKAPRVEVATVTEGFLGFLGYFNVIGGSLAVVLGFVELGNEHDGSGGAAIAYGFGVVVAGAFCFAAQLVLRYLRGIANALQQPK
jgi:Zn-finger nucleic acid-binding protein